MPQIINQELYDFSADVWSLGATLVEMAEKSPPLFDLEPSPAMIQISTKGSPGLKHPESFSPEFNNLISQCMEFDADKRPSVSELLKHPFIMKYKHLKRVDVLKSLLATEMNYSKLMSHEEEEEEEEDAFMDSLNTTPDGKKKKTPDGFKHSSADSFDSNEPPSTLENLAMITKTYKGYVFAFVIAFVFISLKLFGEKSIYRVYGFSIVLFVCLGLFWRKFSR